jgi:hypothetical protein
VEGCEQRRRKRESHRRLKKELKRTKDKARMEYLGNIRQEIMEFKRAGRHEDKGSILDRKPRDSKHWH